MWYPLAPRVTRAAEPTGQTYRASVAVAFTHILADFIDVPPAQLRDTSLVTGLLIAAASAAGLAAYGAPVVRALPQDGLTGLFLLEGSHIVVHTFPDRRLMLLDVLALATHDAQRAVDVFARRVEAREVRTGEQARG